MLKRHFFLRGAQTLALLGVMACGLSAQTPAKQGLDSLVTHSANPIPGNVGYKDLYCAGYVRQSALPSLGQVVGGEQEQEQRVYVQGDYLYLSTGAQQGVRVGQEFALIRPRGTVRSKFSKKNELGVYVQEVGQVRVVSVKEKVSVAVITSACETVLLGDLLSDLPPRMAKLPNAPVNFDRFAEPSGKAVGRIVLARDGQELLTRNQIVVIDLGAEDSVALGTRLTIFRPVGTGNVTTFADTEVTRGATGDFGSERYKGGKFSIQAPRSKESKPGDYDGNILPSPEVKANRPQLPRKLLGDMVVIRVQERTATAIITTVAQEIHTGDYVEIR